MTDITSFIGVEAKTVIEESRQNVAEMLGAKSSGIYTLLSVSFAGEKRSFFFLKLKQLSFVFPGLYLLI
jgi:hypothetical protein